ncbi:MAG: FtsQ-type POTRA domain-containing protein [Pseudomonadales bacterium]|jgi:cell division protein FtsQ|nr:FtsQ-type POTRA domain-containing protein [Pseudomonadales bacterium]MCP5336450.1 FtsQ-type POTRA domain-containing protein [Pseudomonadales bacterium]
MSSVLLRLGGRAGLRRGATRKGAGRRVTRAAWLTPVTIAVLLVVALRLGYAALTEVANVPISKVTVNGDFRFLDREVVERIMLPHLGTGYFMVDLARIRDDLLALPMVYQVTVRRAWPDRLMVFITEQVPVLRFGDDAYLNPYAEVFHPQVGLPGVELPRVDGPAGSETMLLRQFDVFTGLLEPAGLRIARLMLDGKHAWRMRLDNGSEVLLGRRDIERRAARMARLFTHDWAMERDRVERLDMRYTNGVAVAWKGEPAAGRKYRARAGGAGATQQ